jgi:hypothetical protein
MRNTKWCSSSNLIFLFAIAIFFLAEVSCAEGPAFTIRAIPVLEAASVHSPGEEKMGAFVNGTSNPKGGVHSPGEGETIGDPYNWLGTNTKGSGYSSPGGAAVKEGPGWWTQATTSGSNAPALVIGSPASATMQSGSSANYPGAYQDANNNYLWIENVQGRAQYSSIPQYSRTSLIASTSNGGQGQFYELIQSTSSPSTYNSYNVNFQPGSNQIGFDASIVGRHILFYVIYNQSSNVVIVDVGRR